MTLQRYRVALSNWPGQPGVATHYLSTSVNDYTAIRTFWLAIINWFPQGMTATFPSTTDFINETDGKLISSSAVTPGAPAVSSATSAGYSGVSGALIRWNTGAVVNGNKVVGRTYLVPAERNRYQNDGTIVEADRTTLAAAATTLLAAYGDGVKVWARPYAGRPASEGKPAIAARVGSFYTALSAFVPDTAVVLRSRRF